jgi:hypothetical protein
MASSSLKVYTNIKLQDATPRLEDSNPIHEGSENPKAARATREASTLQDLNHELKPSNSRRIFLGILDSLTPLTLKSVSARFRQGTFGNINSSAINCSK